MSQKRIDDPAITEWASAIAASYAQIVAGIIEPCQLLAQAKKEIPHGQWISFCRARNVSRFRVAKLLRIGQHEWLCDPNHFADLPTDEEVLCILAQISGNRLDAALASGVALNKLRRADALRLRDCSFPTTR